LTQEEQSPKVVEEKTIIFYEDELIAARVEDGTIYVPVVRLCGNLGIDWSAQRQRINRDDVLSDALKGVVITTTPSLADGRGGGPQELLCLPIDLIPGWLFGITASRVREDVRGKLIRYRRECFRVLWDAFKTDILPAMDPALAQHTGEMTPAEKALALAEAVAAMARQQVTMERWLSIHDQRLDATEDRLDVIGGRLDRAAEVVGEQSRRLQRIELALAGGATVTNGQAAAISEAVKALAFELGRREPEGANPYQRVYSELYRKFKVPSYRALPADAFPSVMRWLTEWWQNVADEPAPFDTQPPDESA
jgi:hypothetical protein